MTKKPDSEITPKKSEDTKIVSLPGVDLEKKIALMNDQFSVVLRGNQALIMRYWMGSDNIQQLRFLDRKSFELLLANQAVFIDKKKISMSRLWLESPHRNQYDDVYFEPLGEVYEKRYNLWRGFAVVPKKNDKKIERFLDHIKSNICAGDGEIHTWLMAFLADLVQKPYRKLGIALVLRGEMGVGKGVFASHVGKLFGSHYMAVTQQAQVTGRFNSHLANKVLVFVDEGGWSDDRTGAGVLRALITDSYMTIEGKGRDAISMDNCCHLIIAANDEYVVPTGMGDERRMAVLDVGKGNKQDMKYFKGIEEDMRSGGYEGLLHYLQNYEYDEKALRAIPKTEALLDQKMYSMKPEVKWWYGCLTDGEIGSAALSDTLITQMPARQFYDAYLKFCERMRLSPLTDGEIPKKLKNFVPLAKRRKRYGGGRENEYEIPSLEWLRLRFDAAMGQPMEWPIEDDR